MAAIDPWAKTSPCPKAIHANASRTLPVPLTMTRSFRKNQNMAMALSGAAAGGRNPEKMFPLRFLGRLNID
jgi:hypothetical protein